MNENINEKFKIAIITKCSRALFPFQKEKKNYRRLKTFRNYLII